MVDSAADIAGAVNAALEIRNLPELSVATIERLIGTGTRNICKLTLEKLNHDFDTKYLDEMVADFLRCYQLAPVVHTKAYPKVVEGLNRHLTNGIKQGVCTNKSAVMANLVIEQLDLTKYFDVILAGDEVPVCKPDPAHLLAVIEQLGCDKDAVVFVGDTLVDVECAQAAQVDFALVAWGRQQAKEAGYGRIIDDIGTIQER